MKDKVEIDFFGDGMRVFLDYIARQSKKNSLYKSHPLVRAFECAIQAMDKASIGEKSMGVSGENDGKYVYNSYIVVVEKKENGIEVKEIRNVKVDKEIPLDALVIIFRLQISLDKIKGEYVTPEQMVNCLNIVIPGDKFYALGDRWQEARREFKNLLKSGKMHYFDDPELSREWEKTTDETPWENYSNRLRARVGSCIGPSINKHGAMIITSPKDAKIEKYKVFDTAIEFMLGKTAEYLKPFERKE